MVVPLLTHHSALLLSSVSGPVQKHECLYRVPNLDKEPNTIIDVVKTGYVYKESLLRAAQVGVVQGDE
jgi:GrpE